MRKALWFIPLLLAAFLALPASATETVQNGGFTTGDFTDWTTHMCTGGCLSQAWSVATFPSDPGALPPGTSFAANTACVGAPCNDPVSGDWILQDLSTVAGQTYTLSFYYDAGSSSGPSGTTELEALWNGVPVVGGTIFNAPASTWTEYAIAGLTTTSSSTPLEFTVQDPSRLYLTDISVTGSVTPTPEPATWSLMLTGLVLLGLVMVTRKRIHLGHQQAT